MLVAEYLLRRTTRKVVDRVFPRLMEHYPSAEDLARAEPDELWSIAREVGLRKRTLGLIDVAMRVVEHGAVDPDREFLLSLPFVGSYIADAVLLYAFNVVAFPLDGNARRVLYRMIWGEAPPSKVEAYQDGELLRVSEQLVNGAPHPTRARELHQGMLYVAWASCRSRPLCPQCVVCQDCRYGSEYGHDS